MMAKRLAPAVLVLALIAAHEPEARACGGCFVPTGVNTQVTSHRMVLSISQEQTTLWDQILYVGDPESFAWVLPTRGVVEVGLSADAMFQALESMTVVTVLSPPACGFYGGGDGSAAAPGDASSSNGPSKGSDEEAVEVTAHEVVGPYETVQLSSDDPAALRDWLELHGYAVPDDIAPIVSQYVTDGFDFLALKLVPGAGVAAMRPVRITAPGAMPALPLRMVAAGTGATAPISLWIIGEGRYEAANMPNFHITADDLIWNWDTASSTYADVRKRGFEETEQRGWLTEVVLKETPETIEWQVEGFANGPTPAYGSEGVDPEIELAADVEALVGHLDANVVTVTRLYAELSRAALADDLLLEASEDQSEVEATLRVEVAIGTEPTCPEPWETDPLRRRQSDYKAFFTDGCAVAQPAPRGEAMLLLLALVALRRATRQRRASR